MQSYQKDFIEFAVSRGVLRFGEFTLKSGRISPYFFNSGLFNDGESLSRLGQFYAAAITDAGIKFDMLFGPAYKGIPLVSALAIALYQRDHRPVPYCFNRKETKDHGEGGTLLGAPLQGRVLIVDDVITAGTSIRQSMDLIREQGAAAAGILIALDRQERGEKELSAIEEIEQNFQVPVISLISLQELTEFLASREDLQQYLARIRAYRARYGTDG